MGCGKRRLGWVRHKPWFIKGYSPIFFLLEWYPQTKQPFEVYSTNPKLTKKPSAAQFRFCRASMAILYLFMTILIWERNTNHGDLGYVSSHSWTWSKRRSSCMLVIWDHEDWSKWLRPSRDLVGRGGSGSGQVDCLWLASGHWRVQVFWASASSSCWQRTGSGRRCNLLQQGESKALSGRSSGYHQSHWEKWGQFASSPQRSSAVKVTSFLHLHHWTMGRDWWQDWGGTKFVALSESPGPGLSLWRQHWGSWGVLPGRRDRVPYQEAQPEGSPNKTGDFVCMGCTSLHIWRLDTELSAVSSFAISLADLCPASGRYGWKYNLLIFANPTLFHC